MLKHLAIAPILSLAFATAAQAQYVVQWQQVGGGWKSGLHKASTPACPHGSNAACKGQNFAGRYSNGQVTTYWIKGCGRPPIQIKCNVANLLR